MVPPINSSSCLLILRPRPVPSMTRFFSLSTRRNAWNSSFTSSLRIPIPVSSTEILRRTVSASTRSLFASNVTEPSGVYLMAFDNRVRTICLIRISSPYSIDGISEAMLTFNSRFFSCARIQIIFTRSLNNEPVSYCTGTISILPESILDMSKISLIKAKSILLAC